MSFLARLFRSQPDRTDNARPLWHALVAVAREKHWYALEGVADTTPGRFDMVTLVLALTTLRMEGEPALADPMVALTELFVTDMDGQLRQNGIGDLVVGKHVGKLVSSFGGRLGAYREALAEAAPAELLPEALARNVTLLEGVDPARLAAATRALQARFAATGDADLLAGRIAP
jgi:cytochrome b pre-mRNA-processing protein 3